MSQISILAFARYLNSKKASDMARAVGLPWPPSPKISMLDLIKRASTPLAPAFLYISFPVGGVSQDQRGGFVDNVPITGLWLHWTDTAVGTLRQATTFAVAVMDEQTGKFWTGGAIQTPYTQLGIGQPSPPLEYGTTYLWYLVAINDSGISPDSPAYSFKTVGPPPAPPKPTAPPKLHLSITDQSGGNFSIKSVTWTVWQQTLSGFTQLPQQTTPTAVFPAVANGQYLIHADVFATRAATGVAELAQFIGTVQGPGGASATVVDLGTSDQTHAYRLVAVGAEDGLYNPEVTQVS
jgi:hypothetical protein